MPNHLFRAAGAGGRFDNAIARPRPRCQSDGEHVVRHECTTTQLALPDDLRQNIAFTVIGPA